MKLRLCIDYDADCRDIKDKWYCWVQDPGLGFCPFIQSTYDIKRKKLEPGVPCGHPGCFSHVTHPCEGCGRTACGLG